MNAPDERKDEEGGEHSENGAGECGLGGAGGGATSSQRIPILKGAKRKGKTMETKARLLELLGQDGEVTDEAVRKAAKITKYSLVAANPFCSFPVLLTWVLHKPANLARCMRKVWSRTYNYRH